MEKGDQDHLNYHQPSGIPAEWRFGSPQPPPQSLAMMPSNPMGAGSSPCPSVSMVDSYCPTLWDHTQPNSQGLGFPEATNAAPNRPPPTLDSSRLEMGAAASMYLQSGGVGILPPTGLPQFSADSAFIERAARFSCLGGTSFSALMSPFGGMNQPLDGYSTGLKMMLGVQLSPNDTPSMGESSKGMSVDHGSPNGGSPMSSQKDARSQGTAAAGTVSGGEAELNGNGLGENPNSENAAADPSAEGLAAKKRKRNGQEMEIEQAKGDAETSSEKAEGKKGVEENNTTQNKSDGKNNGKSSADPPNEDYVHVRARRGQATNSHSLAERVRREKISERMKFLQDLVPGCSKVTGKAVMLDEIINYVQSLQRQVELLSMKLAAVNPHFDYNIEGLLSKDMIQQGPGPSSAIGFPPDMSHPLLHQPQGFIHPGMSGMGTDVLRRAMGAQMTTMNAYKEAKQQLPNNWENEFQNVFQIGYGTNPSIDMQDLNGSLPHSANDS